MTHLLPTVAPFIEALSQWFELEIIGIPYSSDAEVCAQQNQHGTRAVIASNVSELPQLAYDRVLAGLQEGLPVVVQEVGGYLAEFASDLGSYSDFLGVVEDTNNGHWRYEGARCTLRYPVVSIAQSPIKHLEDGQVGQAVAFSVERILRESFYSTLSGAAVFVIGFGSIGSACARALRRRAARVSVYDSDPLRVAQAAMDGFLVQELAAALAECSVVVGATGTCSIDRDVLNSVRAGTVIFSASSKRVEIDVAMLEDQFEVSPFAPGVQLCRDGQNHFYLAYDGYPVNFRDRSVLGPALDAVYCELFVCVREVAGEQVQTGLKHSWPAIHREVATTWCETYLPTSECDAVEPCRLTPSSRPFRAPEDVDQSSPAAI